MNSLNNHRSFRDGSFTDPDRFFGMIETPFGDDSIQQWEKLERHLVKPTISRVTPVKRFNGWIAAAAAVVILLATLFTLRFYTASFESEYGSILACELPDGTVVKLNAGSRLTYHPWWYRYSRQLHFEGEGYFEVRKGKPFLVSSSNGLTQVLGTSFSIYARNDNYRVTCFTGTVRVASPDGQATTLTPSYSAVVVREGNILVSKTGDLKSETSWLDGMFQFTSRPLRQVFDEIQRQYSIIIHFSDDTHYLFTGYFSKDLPVEEVMEVVCKPFGLNFALRPDGTYEIKPN
jgi:ferric-dicitrate binding protein FerR (iron transport regulator)